jgi:hypothetical protein
MKKKEILNYRFAIPVRILKRTKSFYAVTATR